MSLILNNFVNVCLKLDTGVDFNILPLHVFGELQIDKKSLKYFEDSLTTYSGQSRTN